MKRLLVKDENKRLGSRAGASDLKSHPLLKSTNWALLRNQTPPIIPSLTHPLDGSCFRNLRESISFDFSTETKFEEAECSEDSNPFKEFESITIHRLEE